MGAAHDDVLARRSCDLLALDLGEVEPERDPDLSQGAGAS